MIDTAVLLAAVVLPIVLGHENVIIDDDDEPLTASTHENFASEKVEQSFFGQMRTEMGKAISELDFWTVFGYTFMGSVFFMCYAYYTEYVQTGKSITDDVRELMKENAAKGKTPLDLLTGRTSNANTTSSESGSRKKKISARSKIAKMSDEEKKKFRGD
ncbi:hypothetical protein SARC_01394 [Sphaeroforma arctica JP610]|uniref:Uncharacterized protein n=1 Tax=Sphaeroforma arctica JP610 TaxID=667725 RepID=A0A0L0GDU4_9EUKA|nr:hypothetical protein SARC_01394 [Sphaeroforma arctica JP610]KNC86438.1 hypothetical protein SARC_01394 [Sphaeroforma arctica JP610]|eukprot:XP_014160340.1 hypothetical protein SARC_01394 [Sphaeroforma arctica JP610]